MKTEEKIWKITSNASVFSYLGRKQGHTKVAVTEGAKEPRRSSHYNIHEQHLKDNDLREENQESLQPL